MKKGMLTVIIITIIVGIFICLQAFGLTLGLLESGLPIIFIVIGICIFLSLIGAVIYNSYERIKEIKEEDKDDLSKY